MLCPLTPCSNREHKIEPYKRSAMRPPTLLTSPPPSLHVLMPPPTPVHASPPPPQQTHTCSCPPTCVRPPPHTPTCACRSHWLVSRSKMAAWMTCVLFTLVWTG